MTTTSECARCCDNRTILIDNGDMPSTLKPCPECVGQQARDQYPLDRIMTVNGPAYTIDTAVWKDMCDEIDGLRVAAARAVVALMNAQLAAHNAAVTQ
jgi:hypothetical protein